MSSWTRGIVIPMAILSSVRPEFACRNTRGGRTVQGSHAETAAFNWSKQILSWKNLFLAVDRGLKLYEKLPWKPLRQKAIKEAKEWMLQHMERTEGLAAIYPSMMNSIFALMALGHGPEDPITWRRSRSFRGLRLRKATLFACSLAFPPYGIRVSPW